MGFNFLKKKEEAHEPSAVSSNSKAISKHEFTGIKKTDEKTITKVKSLKFLGELEDLIHARKKLSSEESYIARMYEKGLDKMLQKVGEEATEYVIDAKNNNRERIISEGADLLFHFILSLTAQGLSLQDINDELITRHVHRVEKTEKKNVGETFRKENKK